MDSANSLGRIRAVLRLLSLLVVIVLASSFVTKDASSFAPSAARRHRGRRAGCSLRLAEENKDSDSTDSDQKSMQRPILDQLASALFRLENQRVEASSTVDDKGRFGEPMEWSESNSLANRFSQIVAGNTIGATFKQFVADIIAGDYDSEAAQRVMDQHIQSAPVAMFSFTTCPFCRRAKDALGDLGISYVALELDEYQDLDKALDGNAIRAELGKRTGRTSVPSIFVKGQFIGGCNDGNPGLMPLIESGKLTSMLQG